MPVEGGQIGSEAQREVHGVALAAACSNRRQRGHAAAGLFCTSA